MASRSFQAPTGTRDFYPIELARRRFIEDAWRRVAVRHGFEEIDGPTFEDIELYKAKSGDAIVGEIFQTFSGKDKSLTESGAAFEAPFALRPEFTPTLARMYAARAAQLPKPAKWFWQGACYRAERPQRGRLREFMQWNCDIIGGAAADATAGDCSQQDAEVVACAIDLFAALGLKPLDLRVRISDRALLAQLLTQAGVESSRHPEGLALLDARAKLKPEDFAHRAAAIRFDVPGFDAAVAGASKAVSGEHAVGRSIAAAGLDDWVQWDLSIVRGLAYYTGMVFEVHETSGAMRAVAGGGRYDNLIETFGGPPTPAVGFGMGDVVLSLVLQDKGLMPTDKEIARSLGLRPDVFVISNGQPESDPLVAPMLARLRREGKHARRSYKATKNIGKLLKEAADADARYAIIIESPAELTLKNLDDGSQDKGPHQAMLARVAPPSRP